LAPVGAGCKFGVSPLRLGPAGWYCSRSSTPDDLAGLVEVGEQVLVQALVAQAAIEALEKAILRRLAGCDVMPFDLKLLLPSQDRVRHA
jgi:hypothetical protein